MQDLLKIDKNFTPFPTDDGDELFRNGIFVFNISRMIEYIEDNPGLFTPEVVAVKKIYSTSPHINETHLDSVDVSKPVILAEIAPGRYNLIDGHHRAEKASRQNIETIKAYRLKAQQHIQFLNSWEAYEKYVKYWNDKLKDLADIQTGDTLYQIRIVLKGFDPFIWRLILVKPNMPLSDFHRLIQTVMGWEDIHLHQFIKGDTFYTVKLEGDTSWGTMENVDYKGLTIRDILSKKNEFVTYEYDFGDGWKHEVRLEKIVPAGKKKHPVCLDGRMKCPPEDSGGVWGYREMLDVLNDSKHTERRSYLDWLDTDDFDPYHFDPEEINKRLKKRSLPENTCSKPAQTI